MKGSHMSRLKEPSTYAGIGIVLTGLLPLASAFPSVALALKGLAAACGAIAVALREGATTA